jgi:Ala-tRNA(Pro) deacylase
MADIYSFLEHAQIPYERFDHPAVFTCEEAERLTPNMPGIHTKNLLLRDKKGKRHILVIVGFEKSVDLKELSTILDIRTLSFASEDRLKTHLGVDPGAVTLLGLIHDKDHNVDIVIDEGIWNAESIQCHPLVNTATLVIPHKGIESFLHKTGHKPMIVNVPERK